MSFQGWNLALGAAGARRNPHRIAPFLDALESVWMQHPDMRFGQLVMNLSREPGGFADTWHWEDSEWYRRMEAFVELHTSPHKKQEEGQ